MARGKCSRTCWAYAIRRGERNVLAATLVPSRPGAPDIGDEGVYGLDVGGGQVSLVTQSHVQFVPGLHGLLLPHEIGQLDAKCSGHLRGGPQVGRLPLEDVPDGAGGGAGSCSQLPLTPAALCKKCLDILLEPHHPLLSHRMRNTSASVVMSHAVHRDSCHVTPHQDCLA